MSEYYTEYLIEKRLNALYHKDMSSWINCVVKELKNTSNTYLTKNDVKKEINELIDLWIN